MRERLLLTAICFGLAPGFLQAVSAQTPQPAQGEVPPGAALLHEDLLNTLVEWPNQRAVMPQAYFAGVNRPIKTFGGGNQVVWVRDAPDNFTYDLAKALDEQQILLKGQTIPYYYNKRLWPA